MLGAQTNEQCAELELGELGVERDLQWAYTNNCLTVCRLPELEETDDR